MPHSLSRRSLYLLMAQGCVTIALLCASVVHAAEPAIQLVTDDQSRPVAFEATGLTKTQLTALAAAKLNAGTGLRLLTVHVAEVGKPTTQSPMLGTYQWHGSALRFTPQFPLCDGLNYRAEFRPDAELVTLDTSAQANTYREQKYHGTPIRLDVSLPKKPNTNPTEVTQIYPSTNVLPENQLKFYLHFSAPMSQREAYTHLELLSADGTPVDLPFLELGEELWDGTGTRLTLFIDPGRIKRGVKPREDLGPALTEGQEYTLVVHSDWNDAAGNSLAKVAKKTFRAGPPVITAIDPGSWKISSPQVHTDEPLKIKFPRPLDRALLDRTLKVKGSGKATVSGKITVSDAERQWEFRPAHAWNAGSYELIVDTVLEDLAGNRIGRPFEFDQTGIVDQQVQAETISIKFEITK
jgi:hypothetical protein